eukprot:s2767_g8.t1
MSPARALALRRLSDEDVIEMPEFHTVRDAEGNCRSTLKLTDKTRLLLPTLWEKMEFEGEKRASKKEAETSAAKAFWDDPRILNIAGKLQPSKKAQKSRKRLVKLNEYRNAKGKLSAWCKRSRSQSCPPLETTNEVHTQEIARNPVRTLPKIKVQEVVQVQERIVEVPKVCHVERVVEVPQVHVQKVVRTGQGLEVQEVRTVEKSVEVQLQEVLRHVPKLEVHEAESGLGRRRTSEDGEGKLERTFTSVMEEVPPAKLTMELPQAAPAAEEAKAAETPEPSPETKDSAKADAVGEVKETPEGNRECVSSLLTSGGLLTQVDDASWDDEVGRVDASTAPRGSAVDGAALNGHSKVWPPIEPLETRRPVMSVGSQVHGTGSCKPCTWFWRPQGCFNGEDGITFPGSGCRTDAQGQEERLSEEKKPTPQGAGAALLQQLKGGGKKPEVRSDDGAGMALLQQVKNGATEKSWTQGTGAGWSWWNPGKSTAYEGDWEDWGQGKAGEKSKSDWAAWNSGAARGAKLICSEFVLAPLEGMI